MNDFIGGLNNFLAAAIIGGQKISAEFLILNQAQKDFYIPSFESINRLPIISYKEIIFCEKAESFGIQSCNKAISSK